MLYTVNKSALYCASKPSLFKKLSFWLEVKKDQGRIRALLESSKNTGLEYQTITGRPGTLRYNFKTGLWFDQNQETFSGEELAKSGVLVLNDSGLPFLNY